MRVAAVIVAVAALLSGLAACGSSDDSSMADTGPTASNDPATTQAAKETPVPATGGKWATLKHFAGPDADELIIPQGPSPDQVVTKDLVVGNGPAIDPGDVFNADYISWSYESGKPVEPLPETSNGELTWIEAESLKGGVGERVPGWEPGLKGIHAGGLRELIVPSRLAYGDGSRVYLVKVTAIEPQ
jgi:hypothetical protein